MAEVVNLDLAELVSARQVSVVQELDLGKLATALTALQDAVNARPVEREGPSKEEFAALAAEVAQLKEKAAQKNTEIKALKEQQDELAGVLGSKVGKDEVSPEDVVGLKKGLQDLGEKVEEQAAAAAASGEGGGGGSELEPRVEELEDGLARLKKAMGELKAAPPSSSPPAASVEANANPSAGEESSAGVLPAEVASLLARQQAAEAALADVRDAQDSLRKVQEELRKAQKGATNGAEDAKAAADGAAARLGDQAAQIEALRAAIEAVNKGEKVELPAASSAAPAAVDVGPLERRVAQKADAEDVAAVEARLEDIEAALRAARTVADDAARQSAATAAQSAHLAQQLARNSAPEPHTTHHTTTLNTNSAHTSSYATSEDVSELRTELAQLRARIEIMADQSGKAASAADVAGLQADLEALVKTVAGKASQADVDALLSAGAPLAGAGGAEGGSGGGEGEIDPDSATAASVAITVNGIKVQVAQLQSFMQLLQGRLEDKAGADETESLRRGSDGIRETIKELKETIRELQKSTSDNKSTIDRSNELSKKISTIERRISSLEAMKPSGTNVGGGESGGDGGGEGTGHLESALRECEAGLRGANSQLEELRRQLDELAALRAEVGGATSRHGALDSGISTLREEVVGLRGALGLKADKSEVDALLQTGVSVGGGPDGADSTKSAQLSGDADVKDAIPVLNDLSAQVAQLSSALKVLQERLAGKADSTALDGKADREWVSRVEAALSGKSEEAAVAKLCADLKALRRELNGKIAGGGAAAPPSTGGSHSNAAPALGGDSTSGLWDALAGKADRGEVQALKELVDALGMTGPTAPTPPGTGTAAEKVSQREMVANRGQQSSPALGPGGGSGGADPLFVALRRDVESLAGAVEAIAQAANVMGVGPNDAMMPISGPTHYPVDAALAAAAASNGAGAAGVDGASFRDRQGGASVLSSAGGGVVVGPTGVPHGAADKLRDLLRLGAFNHKMDWFNPAWLEDLARRIGDLESGLRAIKKSGAGGKPPATAEMPGRSQGGGKDYDKMIMKLGKDIAGLKKALAELGAPGGGGGWGGTGGARVPDGDHAMLSSKPLFGYRCMACDRPLDKLDEKPGPYIPTGQMPSSVAPYERRGIGVPVGIDQAPKPMHDAKGSHEHSASRNRAAGSDGRGPQNWYQDSHGPSAAHLPRNDVGPHLPPGGWRGNDQGTSTGFHQRRNSRGSMPGYSEPGKLPMVPNGDGSPQGLQPKPSSSTEGSPHVTAQYLESRSQ